jgi:hypothetical protein
MTGGPRKSQTRKPGKPGQLPYFQNREFSTGGRMMLDRRGVARVTNRKLVADHHIARAITFSASTTTSAAKRTIKILGPLLAAIAL